MILDGRVRNKEGIAYLIKLILLRLQELEFNGGGSGGSQNIQQVLENGSEAELSSTDEENKEIFITISKSDTPSGISKESALGFSVQAFNSEATYYDESDYDLRKNAGIAYQALEDRAEAYIITNIGTTKQSISLGGQDASTPNGIRVEDTYANIGLTSGTYFGDNATNNTYVQKKYVDDAITLAIPTPPGTGTYRLESTDGVVTWVADI